MLAWCHLLPAASRSGARIARGSLAAKYAVGLKDCFDEQNKR